MSIASLVLGIIAVLVALIPFLGIVAFLPALLGGVLGLIGALRKKPGRGLAVAGLLLCTVAGVTAGLNFKATDKAVTALDEAVNGREVPDLALHGVFIEPYANGDYTLLLDIQNNGGRTINGFRGHVAFYDEFDKVVDHLVLVDNRRSRESLDHVVGAYRLLPGDRAASWSRRPITTPAFAAHVWS